MLKKVLKSIIEIDQLVLGIFQHVVDLFFWKFEQNTLQLAMYCYATMDILIAIELVLQDKIFTEGIGNDWLIKAKIITFLLLIVVCMVVIILTKKRDEKWGKQSGYPNAKQHSRIMFVLRTSCSVIGILAIMFCNINLMTWYVGIFLLTNACAFYFLSCEPGTTNPLNQKSGIVVV